MTGPGLWRPWWSPLRGGWVFVCRVSAWPSQINTTVNSWGDEHTYATFSHPYPCPCTRCNAHTCMQTHRRTHTLTLPQSKHFKMTYKLSRDRCCYLFFVARLTLSRAHRLLWRKSSLTEKDSKRVFLKAVSYSPPCTLKASSVLGLPGRRGQKITGSEVRGQSHRQRDAL